MIPEQTASVPAYTFAKCSALSKSNIFKNMNRNRQHSICKEQSGKTFSCPKANKTFAVKKGMLTTRSGKTLVLVPNKMKKLTIPSSVKEIQSKCSKWISGNKYCNSKVSEREIRAKALESKEDYKSKAKQ